MGTPLTSTERRAVHAICGPSLSMPSYLSPPRCTSCPPLCRCPYAYLSVTHAMHATRSREPSRYSPTCTYPAPSLSIIFNRHCMSTVCQPAHALPSDLLATQDTIHVTMPTYGTLSSPLTYAYLLALHPIQACWPSRCPLPSSAPTSHPSGRRPSSGRRRGPKARTRCGQGAQWGWLERLVGKPCATLRCTRESTMF